MVNCDENIWLWIYYLCEPPEVSYYIAKIWDVEEIESLATGEIPLRMGTNRYLDIYRLWSLKLERETGLTYNVVI